MPLQILGLNHNTAPVEIREQVVFAGDEVGRALSRLTEIEGVDEAVLLSTCNRTEFYIVTSDGGRERLREWLQNDRNLDPGFSDSLFGMDGEGGFDYDAFEASLDAVAAEEQKRVEAEGFERPDPFRPIVGVEDDG